MLQLLCSDNFLSICCGKKTDATKLKLYSSVRMVVSKMTASFVIKVRPVIDVDKLNTCSLSPVLWASDLTSRDCLIGRLFGDVAVYVRQSFASIAKLFSSSKRYIIVLIGQLLLINVYLPCVSLNSWSCRWFYWMSCKYYEWYFWSVVWCNFWWWLKYWAG